MVQLHIKRGDKSHFLYETTVEEPVAVACKEIVEIHNLRLKVNRLCSAAEELAKHGPMKTPEAQGLDDDTALLDDVQEDGSYAQRDVARGAHFNQDPTERRTGNAAAPDMTAIIQRTVEDGKKAASEKNVEMKVFLTRKMLDDAIDAMKGAVMIVYPMGLPDYDVVRQILEEREELDGTATSLEVLEPENTSLWFASKEMTSDKKLRDFVGKHEKSKVIVKLQKKGAGAPVREPVVSADEQKAMIAFYHKKEQEQKKMAQENEDDFLNSSWADPKAMKKSFTGMGDVSWKAR